MGGIAPQHVHPGRVCSPHIVLVRPAHTTGTSAAASRPQIWFVCRLLLCKGVRKRVALSCSRTILAGPAAHTTFSSSLHPALANRRLASRDAGRLCAKFLHVSSVATLCSVCSPSACRLACTHDLKISCCFKGHDLVCTGLPVPLIADAQRGVQHSAPQRLRSLPHQRARHCVWSRCNGHLQCARSHQCASILLVQLALGLLSAPLAYRRLQHSSVCRMSTATSGTSNKGRMPPQIARLRLLE